MALWTVVLIVTLGFTSISGNNLDARFSVIKKGKDNSYFGFSVAQHQILDGNDKVLHNVYVLTSISISIITTIIILLLVLLDSKY